MSLSVGGAFIMCVNIMNAIKLYTSIVGDTSSTRRISTTHFMFYLSRRESSAFRCEKKRWPHQTLSPLGPQECGSCYNLEWRWHQDWGSAEASVLLHIGSQQLQESGCFLGCPSVWLLPYPCIAHSPLSMVWKEYRSIFFLFCWVLICQLPQKTENFYFDKKDKIA